MKEEIEELKQQIEDLKKRMAILEDWIATHHCQSYPPNIKRVIGKPLSTEWIPDIYDD